MTDRTRSENLTDAQIQAIIKQTELQARGGKAGAVARAGLGTLALVVAVFAVTDTETVGLIVLCGIFILGLAGYIRTVARAAKAGYERPRPQTEPISRSAVSKPAATLLERPIGS